MNKSAQKFLALSIAPILAIGIVLVPVIPAFAQVDTDDLVSSISATDQAFDLAANQSDIRIDQPVQYTAKGNENELRLPPADDGSTNGFIKGLISLLTVFMNMATDEETRNDIAQFIEQLQSGSSDNVTPPPPPPPFSDNWTGDMHPPLPPSDNWTGGTPPPIFSDNWTGGAHPLLPPSDNWTGGGPGPGGTPPPQSDNWTGGGPGPGGAPPPIGQGGPQTSGGGHQPPGGNQQPPGGR